MTHNYYTISHRETGIRLGLGGPLDRSKVLSIIRLRSRGSDGAKFSPSEWMVTAWLGDGGDDDEIQFQVSADEFSHCNGII